MAAAYLKAVWVRGRSVSRTTRKEEGKIIKETAIHDGRIEYQYDWNAVFLRLDALVLYQFIKSTL